MAAGKTLSDKARRGRIATVRSRLTSSQSIRQVGRRLSWGVADQAVSSITNFAVNIFIARDLGAVQYGAFGLAYVTYGFALQASRGLATDPLLVRFSGTDLPTWRRAVANSTGTALVTGFGAGACVLIAAMVLHGPTRLAFLALGLTMPGLMLQDSWRFAFFALGRGSQAFLNDMVWAAALVPALLLLRHVGHPSVFWFVFAWGASAAAGAAMGPLQARLYPRPTRVWAWLAQQSDLGPRYLLEGTSNSAASLLRNYGIGLVLGLAAVGYLQAATTLMGPFQVVLYGMGLVALPEATRIMRRSTKQMWLFCVLLTIGLTLMGLVWGVALLVALPRGLGIKLLGPIWRQAYPLVLPTTLFVAGGCASSGAATWLHALGAARRSLRAAALTSLFYLVFSLLGAAEGGAVGAIRGAAVGTWLGAGVYWWQLRAARREGTDLGAAKSATAAIGTDAPPAGVPSADVTSATTQSEYLAAAARSLSSNQREPSHTAGRSTGAVTRTAPDGSKPGCASPAHDK